MILYGIPTCDTCRKARKALTEDGHSVTFRDIRADPLTGDEIARLLDLFGDKLINRASATWRSLSEADRALPPVQLISAHPSVMKRPVIADDAQHRLGWTPEIRAAFSA